MDKVRFISLLKDPSQANQADVNGLKTLLAEYPYFQAARVLLAKAKDGDIDEVKSASTYTTNRYILQDIINDTFDTTHHIQAVNRLQVEEDDLSVFDKLSGKISAQEDQESNQEATDITYPSEAPSSEITVPTDIQAGYSDDTIETTAKQEQETDQDELLQSFRPAEVEIDTNETEGNTEQQSEGSFDSTYNELMANLEEYKRNRDAYMQPEEKTDDTKTENAHESTISKEEQQERPSDQNEAQTKDEEQIDEESDETRALRKSMEQIRAMREAYTNQPSPAMEPSVDPEKENQTTQTTAPANDEDGYANSIITSEDPYDYPDYSDTDFDQPSKTAPEQTEDPYQYPKEETEEPDFIVEYGSEGEGNDTDLFADPDTDQDDVDYLNANQFALNDFIDDELPTAENKTPIASISYRKPKEEASPPPEQQSTNTRRSDTGTLKKQADIIEEFIAKNAKLSIDKENLPQGTQTDLAYDTVRSAHSAITENLAIIMKKQGKTQRAIEIYQQLQLKYPEKSNYFAAQIENLRQS